MPLLPELLLADLADLLSGLLPIIIAILYGLAHLVGALQQDKRKGNQRPRPRPAPQELAGNPPAGNAPANQGNLEDSLRREVEEFLRRAQGQPQQRPGPAQPPARRPAPTPPRSLSDRPQSARPAPAQRAADSKPPRRLVEPAKPELVSTSSEPFRPMPSATAAAAAGTAGSRHLGDSLRSQEVAQHAHALGAQVALADERMEEHLRQVFTHQVGTLGARSAVGEQRAAATPAAQGIRQLLASPGGVRQLIIASEILRRPDERWDH